MKEIAELIHDRAFAEGASVVVWTDCAKFRVVSVAEGRERLRPRTIFVEDKLGNVDLDGDVKVPGYGQDNVSSSRFKPSEDLMKIMKRNAEEFQNYLDHLVMDWNEEIKSDHGFMGPFGRSRGSTRVRGSQQIRECHAVTRSGISEKSVKSGARAVLAAFALVILAQVKALATIGEVGVRPDGDSGGARADFAPISEVCTAGIGVTGAVGAFGGKA